MERYHFSDEQKSFLEHNPLSFAIYQFIDRRVVTLILSDGFLEMFGYEDREMAYHDMDHDKYKDTHPDDASRIADYAFRFATEENLYDVIYRTKCAETSAYKVIHAVGKHIYTSTGVRLS